jgi:hypothetical protein
LEEREQAFYENSDDPPADLVPIQVKKMNAKVEKLIKLMGNISDTYMESTVDICMKKSQVILAMKQLMCLEKVIEKGKLRIKIEKTLEEGDNEKLDVIWKRHINLTLNTFRTKFVKFINHREMEHVCKNLLGVFRFGKQILLCNISPDKCINKLKLWK